MTLVLVGEMIRGTSDLESVRRGGDRCLYELVELVDQYCARKGYQFEGCHDELLSW